MHELAEVAGVGAVLGAVLTPEVEELVQWDGSEVEGYLLEVDGDDVSCGGQVRRPSVSISARSVCACVLAGCRA